MKFEKGQFSETRAIFRNEITTILKLSTSKEGVGGGEGDHVFRFGGP